jgi:hypothetical protein
MKARLMDQDTLSDDVLAEAVPDSSGNVAFQFKLGLASSVDSPGETQPDLYIQVLLDDVEVFRSGSIKDVDFLMPNPVTGLQDSVTQDLGTFQLPDLRGLDPLSRRDFMRSIVGTTRK